MIRVLIPLWCVVFAIAFRMWLDDHLWLRARRRSREPGLNTVAEADAFVRDLRAEEGDVAGRDSNPHALPLSATSGRPRLRGELTPLEHNETAVRVPRLRTTPLVLGLKPEPVKPVRTEPVFVLESTPIYDSVVADFRRWRRAVRVPTQEMRLLFDALTAAWECSHCAEGDCATCPGCSCECRLVAA